jgi:hypothetical protein
LAFQTAISSSVNEQSVRIEKEFFVVPEHAHRKKAKGPSGLLALATTRARLTAIGIDDSWGTEIANDAQTRRLKAP